MSKPVKKSPGIVLPTDHYGRSIGVTVAMDLSIGEFLRRANTAVPEERIILPPIPQAPADTIEGD